MNIRGEPVADVEHTLREVQYRFQIRRGWEIWQYLVKGLNISPGNPASVNQAASAGVSRTRILASMSLLIALVFVATSSISIPIPATEGYFNLGDSMVFLASLIFGSVIGSLAGGIGSALSDVYLGYAIYAPGTLVIKGLEGYLTGLIFLFLTEKKHKVGLSSPAIFATVSCVFGGFEMVLGYFIYELVFLGVAAIAEVPANLGQVFFGTLIAVTAYSLVGKRLEQYFKGVP